MTETWVWRVVVCNTQMAFLLGDPTELVDIDMVHEP